MRWKYAILVALMLAAGCHKSPSTVNSSVGPHEWFLFLPALPLEKRAELAAEIELQIQTLPVEDVVHFILVPSHQPLGSIVIPDVEPLDRVWDMEVQASLAKVLPLLTEEASAGSLQVEVPSTAASVNSLRRTDAPVRIVLMGALAYQNDRQDGYDMTKGDVPKHGAFKLQYSPFAGGEVFPEETEISWWEPVASAVDEKHRTSMVEFFHHYFALRNASLGRVSYDLHACFDFEHTHERSVGAIDETADGNMERATIPTEQRDVSPEPPMYIEVDRMSSKMNPEALEDTLRLAEEQQEGIVLAAIWESADPKCDVDMIVTVAGEPEQLSYANTTTDFGELVDVRAPAGADRKRGSEPPWEVARLKTERMEDVSLNLLTFKATAPATVRVIGVWRGVRREVELQLGKAGKPISDLSWHRSINLLNKKAERCTLKLTFDKVIDKDNL